MKSKLVVVLSFCFLFLVGILAINNGPSATLAAASGGDASVFMPITFRPAPDLLITAVEINQSVQRANNSVPLVANRNTLVRVYAVAPGGPQSNIVVRLSASRNGSQLGVMNSAPITIPQTTSRAVPNSSVNFNLPAGWLSGNVVLTAVVDATNVIPNEPSESNNTVVTNMNFNSIPDLQIKVIPIQYTHQGSHPGLYPAQSVDYISDWIERVFPVSNVNVDVRNPFPFIGNLENGDDWLLVQNNQPVSGLLWDMTVLKQSEIGLNTPIIYYAFVPISNSSSTWFSSGIAGIGWIGDREAAGLNLGNNDQTGSLAGHEVGHNLNRRHAPCGNVAGPDPNYPYSGASIGEYGIDIPNLTFWTPATAVDFMSYCDPAWTSDYTYIGLYNDQAINGHTAELAPVESMLVAIGLTESGEFGLISSYAFDMVPTLETGDSGYEVELLDAAGQVIASRDLLLREAEEEGVSGKLLLAVVPLPAVEAASVRVVSAGGDVRASQPLTSAQLTRSLTAVAARTGDNITLTWPAADTPAIIRYTPDGGESWVGLAVDVTGGTFTIPADQLPAGAEASFEIILANSGSPAVLTAVLP